MPHPCFILHPPALVLSALGFSSPLWLIGLIPWTAVVIYLLSGSRQRAAVPFLNLWRGDEISPRVRRAVHVPPAALLLVLLALLLAILAAAGPGVQRDGSANRGKMTSSATTRPEVATIVNASARRQPRPQVMVSVRNDSPSLNIATLIIGGASQPIDLPPMGQMRNYFIDLEQLPKSIPIELAGQRALLERQGSWPRIQLHGAEDLPAPVRRMIETYTQLRPADELSKAVVVSSMPVSVDQPAIAIAPNGSTIVGLAAQVQVQDHPVTAVVDWSAALTGASLADAPAEAGWRAVVSADGSPAVAVRDQPARQAWVGLASDSFPRSGDFVVFWTNLLDWAGDARDEYVLLTANGPLTGVAPTEPVDSDLLRLAPGLIIAALVLILIAAIAWAGPSRRS